MPNVSTHDFTNVLPTLLTELVHGSPNPEVGTYMLNRGDIGLLGSLEKISASAASATKQGGGSIAAHVDHVRYGLSLLTRWAKGEETPWRDADWTTSWRTSASTEEEWRTLRDELRKEADAWTEALRTPREVHPAVLNWIVGSVAHLAYHVGAIRQIDRATRGPTADDERRVEQSLRAREPA
jgi:hypothetical protein